jgi:hypothetical protein
MESRAPVLFALVGLLLLGACSQPAAQLPDPPFESLAIYRVALDAFEGTPPYVVQSELILIDRTPRDRVRKALHELSDEAACALDLRLEHETTAALLPDSLGPDVSILSRTSLEKLSRRTGKRGMGLPDLSSKHDANGFFFVSPVGLNAAGDEAVVYVVYYCGPLCATARVIRLARDQDGLWSVTDAPVVWVS